MLRKTLLHSLYDSFTKEEAPNPLQRYCKQPIPNGVTRHPHLILSEASEGMAKKTKLSLDVRLAVKSAEIESPDIGVPEREKNSIWARKKIYRDSFHEYQFFPFSPRSLSET